MWKKPLISSQQWVVIAYDKISWAVFVSKWYDFSTVWLAQINAFSEDNGARFPMSPQHGPFLLGGRDFPALYGIRNISMPVIHSNETTKLDT